MLFLPDFAINCQYEFERQLGFVALLLFPPGIRQIRHA